MVPSDLRSHADRAASGETVSLSPRTLMAWFGAYRRGRHKVDEVRAALAEVDMVTWPDFTAVHFDGEIELRKKSVPREPDSNDSGAERGPDRDQDVDVDERDYDSVPRLAQLKTASIPPTAIKRDQPIEAAETTMLRFGFSQLPVMQGNRNPDGFISWKSIGLARARGDNVEFVRDALVADVLVLKVDTNLFDAVQQIAEHDFCLVEGVGKKISGIVTSYDVALHFDELARPFLLLSQIEGHLRNLIAPYFSTQELAAARDSADQHRDVEHVSDLTFGEYQRLLQNPDNWARIPFRLHRSTFNAALEEVREIRNAVMHFSPDSGGDEELRILRDTSRFLAELVPARGAGSAG